MANHKDVTRADAHAPGTVTDYIEVDEASAPGTAAANTVRVYAKSDGKLYIVDDAGTETDLTGAGGGGGSGAIPEWVSYLAERQGDETAHADDDFFTDDSKAGTEQTVSGSATWTEGRGRLSVTFSNQTGGDGAFYLNALTPSSTPVTIETAATFYLVDGSHAVGLCFTDGTAASSNHASAVLYNDGGGNLVFQERAGTLTNIGATSSIIDAVGVVPIPAGRFYLRNAWTASNTFEISISVDGVVWNDLGAGTLSHTMTPTHFGVWATTSGSGTQSQAAFDYLRVAESDLSP